MGRITAKSIVFMLMCALAFSSAAQSATVPDNKTPDAANERNPLRYRLATLPSTNKKRVDAMCTRFLSLIPKAMLIPKTEERTVYRLIANTFNTIEPAKKRKAELLHHCESPFVLKGDQGYTVIAGSQLTETLALAEQKRLAGKNIPTTIHELRLPLKQWQMKSTEHFDIRDAVIMASKLARIGVITTIETDL